MKKIGIITLHRSFSYGACLQAFATYRILCNLGNDAEFVDYVNKTEQAQNRIIYFDNSKSLLSNIIKTFENIILLQFYNRKKSFQNFHNSLKTINYNYYINQGGEIGIDVLLSGSDQLWNPEIFNGIDSNYFLNFGDAKQKIAYAASAGSYVFSEKQKEDIGKYLSKYNAISVRESFLKEQISDIARCEIATVVDPTLLLSKQEWNDIVKDDASFTPKGPYILLYMIGVPYTEYLQCYKPIVEYYKKKLKIPVYAITPFSFIKIKGTDKSLNKLTPWGFIKAIRSASFVISSSFHGIAFSVIHNKNFVALKTNNSTRISNLLNSVGLSHKYIDPRLEKNIEVQLTPIDYSSVNISLKKLREESINWLTNAIDNE